MLRASLAFAAAFAASPPAAADTAGALPGCAWKDERLAFAGGILTFRGQACDGTTAPEVAFAIAGPNILVMRYAIVEARVAQFWPLDGRLPSAIVADVAGARTPEAERRRCRVELDNVTRHYVYAPDAAYLEELLAKDEPYAVCGEFGDTNDGVQYFTAVSGSLLAFLWVGQDVPLFDPGSFRFEAGQ